MHLPSCNSPAILDPAPNPLDDRPRQNLQYPPTNSTRLYLQLDSPRDKAYEVSVWAGDRHSDSDQPDIQQPTMPKTSIPPYPALSAPNLQLDSERDGAEKKPTAGTNNNPFDSNHRQQATEANTNAEHGGRLLPEVLFVVGGLCLHGRVAGIRPVRWLVDSASGRYSESVKRM